MILDKSSRASIEARTSGAIFFVIFIKSWNFALINLARFSPSLGSIEDSAIKLTLTLENFVSDSKESMWALCEPSTRTLTVPSGNFIN